MGTSAEADDQDPVRVLVVEDDARLAGLLDSLLRAEGYDVTLAPDGQTALHRALTNRYGLLIIDRGLPAIEGLDLLSRLRSSGVRTPAMMLTARGTLEDRVAGLDAGADDYLVKPFEVPELLARLRVLLRRHEDRSRMVELTGTRVLDVEGRRVVDRSGRDPEVSLSDRESALLHVLAARPSRTFTRDELLHRVFDDAATANTVDTYVYYLRGKLGKRCITTVRGIGYRLGGT